MVDLGPHEIKLLENDGLIVPEGEKYVLLKDAGDFEVFREHAPCSYGNTSEAPGYPCFVSIVFNAIEETEYSFLSAREISEMAATLQGAVLNGG